MKEKKKAEARVRRPHTSCKLCSNGTINRNGFCDHGCNCEEARDFERTKIEKKLGIEFNKPFFVYGRIKIVASGHEVPTVILSIGAETIQLDGPIVSILASELLTKGVKWCEEGYCPGIS